MNFKMNITTKVTSVVLTMVLLSSWIIGGVNYYYSYKQIKEASGIELEGCANITVGLLNALLIEEIQKGNLTPLTEVESKINWTTHQKPIFESHAILSLDGKVIAADRTLKNQGVKSGDSFYVDKNAVQNLLESKHPSYSDTYEFNGKKRMTGYAPIFKDNDFQKEVIALNAISFDADVISQRVYEMNKVSLWFGIIIPFIAAIIVSLFIRKITKPIGQLQIHVEKVADGDLTADEIQIHSQDEIGQLSTHFNQMSKNLKKVILQIDSCSAQVASSSAELRASAEQTSNATTQITTSIQDIAIGAENQSKKSVEMNQEVEKVFLKVKEGDQVLDETVKQMTKMNGVIEESASIIKQLGERSNEIGQIVDVITDLSDQTSLLALNAAIEAARAGEHGKGFAVVADEVRKLAEQSEKSAKQIAELISHIQKDTEKAVHAMNMGTEEVSKGLHAVSKTEETFNQIQQSIQSVTSKIKEVEIISAQSSKNTQHVASTSQEQLASMEEVLSSTIALENLAEELKNMLSQFKI